MATPLTERLARGELVVTDGGIETRVMYDPTITMDEHVQVAAMVGERVAGPVLRAVYAGYVDAAARHGVPVIIGTPTFRASARYTQRAGLGGDEAVRRLNRAAVEHHRDLREERGHDAVTIAGVLGPAGDAYEPAQALDPRQAESYHRLQCETLVAAGVDVLFAATFPAVDEAIGVVRAMAATGVPHAVSFVLDEQGRLLDGTGLEEAVDRVDTVTPPTWFSLSCIHPTVAHRALEATSADARRRIQEVKANAAALSTDVLVRLNHPVGDPPDTWASAMWSLHLDAAVPVLGGCCGTDDRHIEALAARMESARRGLSG